MASLVLKNVPRQLHQRLKVEAVRNRRSMTQQAIVLLETSLGAAAARTPSLKAADFPPAQKLMDPATGKPTLLTQPMLRRAIREGRA